MRAPSWTGMPVNRTVPEEMTAIHGGIAAESLDADVPTVPEFYIRQRAGDIWHVVKGVDLD